MILKGRRGYVDNGREGPAAEQSGAHATAADATRIVDAAEDKAMALIEGGGCTFGLRVEAILR